MGLAHSVSLVICVGIYTCPLPLPPGICFLFPFLLS